MAFYSYAIASGYNNQAGLVNIESITPTGDRAFMPPDNYGTFDPGVVRIRGDGTVYFAGFRSAEWVFRAITRDQIRYLMDTYGQSSYSGKVTIRTRTDDPDQYEDYNAILILPKLGDVRKVTSGFADYRVRFIRLVTL